MDVEKLVEAMREAVASLEKLAGRPVQEYLSVDEVAAVVGLSSKHVRRAMSRGELPYSNVGGKRRPTYRIARKDVDAWVAAGHVKRGPAKSDRDSLVSKYFGKG